MKSLFRLFFCAFLLLQAVGSLGGCSFKKKNIGSDVGVETISVKPKSLTSLEELMISESDQYIVDQLLLHKDHYLTSLESKQRALDAAILASKYMVVQKLLLYGVNPFKISEQSYREIDSGGQVSGLILSAQKIVIEKLVNAYPPANFDLPPMDGTYEDYLASIRAESKPFLDRVDQSDLGPRGCQSLVDVFLNRHYFNQTSSSSEKSVSAVVETIRDTSCKNYVQSFSIELVQKWLSMEFYHQYQDNFKSFDFLKFLLTLKPVKSLNIVLPNVKAKTKEYGTVVTNSQLKVDPMAMLFLKLPCVPGNIKDTWYDLVAQLRDDIGDEYIFRIRTPQDESVYTCAKEEVDSCYSNGNNLLELYVLYNLTVSTSTMSFEEFKNEQLAILNPGFRSEGDGPPPFYGLLCGEAK